MERVWRTLELGREGQRSTGFVCEADHLPAEPVNYFRVSVSSVEVFVRVIAHIEELYDEVYNKNSSGSVPLSAVDEETLEAMAKV